MSAAFTIYDRRNNDHSRHEPDDNSKPPASTHSPWFDMTSNRLPRHNPRPDKRGRFEPQSPAHKQPARRPPPATAIRPRSRSGLRHWQTMRLCQPARPGEAFLFLYICSRRFAFHPPIRSRRGNLAGPVEKFCSSHRSPARRGKTAEKRRR